MKILTFGPLNHSEIEETFSTVSGASTKTLRDYHNGRGRPEVNLKLVVEEAENAMIKEAEKYGANAIVGAQYSTNVFREGNDHQCFCTVIGTPVRFKE